MTIRRVNWNREKRMNCLAMTNRSSIRNLTAFLSAGIGVLLCAFESQADIVNYVIVGGSHTMTIPAGQTTETVFDVNIDGDAAIDFTISGFEDSRSGQVRFLIEPVFGGNSLVRDAGQPSILGLGTMVDSASDWSGSGNQFPATDFSGYVGTDFDIPGGSPHFGFLTIARTGNSLTIFGGAYESISGQGISAGASAIPEPFGLAFFAAGASVCSLLRRRTLSI